MEIIALNLVALGIRRAFFPKSQRTAIDYITLVVVVNLLYIVA